MIKCNQVSKRYVGGFEALNHVDFTLEKGEMAFLTGHSGAGKSTLLKLIARLELPSSGEIIVNGKSLSRLKKHELAHYRADLGLTFQTPQLLKERNVFENVGLPLLIQGMPHAVAAKRVQAALDRVDLLSKEKMFPTQLSGGEQQRVAIARAIVHKPKLLLADEPTGNLDPALSNEVMQIFTQLNQSGVAVLIATHDLGLIAGMKHRILMLKAGQLC